MSIKTGDILNFAYTGAVQSIELPKGTYKLECWGAKGGDSSNTAIGGKGGYSLGQLVLPSKTQVYIYSGGSGTAGESGSIKTGGFNGGGDGSYGGGGSGGGASDIRIGQDSLYARIIVAGAGGGGANANATVNGGVGGGTSGGQGGDYSDSYSYGSNPGTQTSGGEALSAGTEYSGLSGSFGEGGRTATSTNTKSRSGGGGAGWYGGAGGRWSKNSSYYRRYAGGGGGGSGYVYTEATAANYPSGCLLTSAYYLTDAQTIAGDQSFASPDGTAETGHAGDGYVRITAIDVKSLSMPVKINGVWKNSDAAFAKINGIWKPVESVYTKINGVWKPNS